MLVSSNSYCRAVSLATLLCSGCVFGQHCSLEVRLRKQSGVAVVAKITVVEESGRSQSKVSDSVAPTRFCDLGIKPVTILLGDDCSRLTLTGVEVGWAVTKRLDILFDPCNERPDLPPSLACSFLFRVADKTGRPAGGAKIPDTSLSLETDAFGRVFFSVSALKEVPLRIEFPGHRPYQTVARCPSAGSANEVEVQLTEE